MVLASLEKKPLFIHVKDDIDVVIKEERKVLI